MIFTKADRERLERLEGYVAEIRAIYRNAGQVYKQDREIWRMDHDLNEQRYKTVLEGLDKLLQSHAAIEKQMKDGFAANGDGMAFIRGDIALARERPNGKAKKAAKRG